MRSDSQVIGDDVFVSPGRGRFEWQVSSFAPSFRAAPLAGAAGRDLKQAGKMRENKIRVEETSLTRY